MPSRRWVSFPPASDSNCVFPCKHTFRPFSLVLCDEMEPCVSCELSVSTKEDTGLLYILAPRERQGFEPTVTRPLVSSLYLYGLWGGVVVVVVVAVRPPPFRPPTARLIRGAPPSCQLSC
uniref:Uncharacterized protein n=1 Tax=Timema poppense TaxID=170557 RepID=A0A7R9HG40_TIMPO|nr:unnamed protein product [Timema poppensis]